MDAEDSPWVYNEYLPAKCDSLLENGSVATFSCGSYSNPFVSVRKALRPKRLPPAHSRRMISWTRPHQLDGNERPSSAEIRIPNCPAGLGRPCCAERPPPGADAADGRRRP